MTCSVAKTELFHWCFPMFPLLFRNTARNYDGSAHIFKTINLQNVSEYLLMCNILIQLRTSSTSNEYQVNLQEKTNNKSVCNELWVIIGFAMTIKKRVNLQWVTTKDWKVTSYRTQLWVVFTANKFLQSTTTLLLLLISLFLFCTYVYCLLSL